MWVILLDAGIFVYNGLTQRPREAFEDAVGFLSGTHGIFNRPVQVGTEISGYTVTSGYGRRSAPAPGASTNHLGVDLGTPTGTSIYMVGNGRV